MPLPQANANLVGQADSYLYIYLVSLIDQFKILKTSFTGHLWTFKPRQTIDYAGHFFSFSFFPQNKWAWELRTRPHRATFSPRQQTWGAGTFRFHFTSRLFTKTWREKAFLEYHAKYIVSCSAHSTGINSSVISQGEINIHNPVHCIFLLCLLEITPK